MPGLCVASISAGWERSALSNDTQAQSIFRLPNPCSTKHQCSGEA